MGILPGQHIAVPSFHISLLRLLHRSGTEIVRKPDETPFGPLLFGFQKRRAANSNTLRSRDRHTGSLKTAATFK